MNVRHATQGNTHWTHVSHMNVRCPLLWHECETWLIHGWYVCVAICWDMYFLGTHWIKPLAFMSQQIATHTYLCWDMNARDIYFLGTHWIKLVPWWQVVSLWLVMRSHISMTCDDKSYLYDFLGTHLIKLVPLSVDGPLLWHECKTWLIHVLRVIILCMAVCRDMHARHDVFIWDVRLLFVLPFVLTWLVYISHSQLYVGEI